jgi:hypothetical protein
MDVAEQKFSKREPALSPCWLGKFICLNIFQIYFGTVQNLSLYCRRWEDSCSQRCLHHIFLEVNDLTGRLTSAASALLAELITSHRQEELSPLIQAHLLMIIKKNCSLLEYQIVLPLQDSLKLLNYVHKGSCSLGL